MNQEFLAYSQIKEILVGEDISQERIETTTQKFFDREREQPIVQVRKNILGSSPDPVKTFFPAIVTMFILFAITLNARTLVEERKKGTLERLLTTRLTVSEIFLGKFMANTSRGFIQAFILLALAYAVFQLFTPLSFGAILVIALCMPFPSKILALIFIFFFSGQKNTYPCSIRVGYVIFHFCSFSGLAGPDLKGSKLL